MSAIDVEKSVELAIELVREAHKERKLQELTKGKVRQQIEASLGYETGALSEKPYKKQINEAVDSTVEQLKSRANQTIVNGEGDSRKAENEKPVKQSSPGKKRKSTDADGSPARKTKSKSSGGAGRYDKNEGADTKEKPSSKRKKQKEKNSTDGTSKKEKEKEKIPSTGKRESSQENKGNFKSKETIVSDEDVNEPTEPSMSFSPSSSLKKAKRAIVSDAEDEGESSTPPKRRRKSEGSPSEAKRKLDPEDKGNGDIHDTELKSDSELSVLLDDPSPKKKKKKNVQKSKGDSEKKSSSKKETKELSPNEEQIKKLKSLIVACGVRKVWSKELKDCETPSSQIAHLRRLLTDLGMKGRFSLEQAKAIKAKRDLEREMADVQEFAQRYAEDRPKRSAQNSPAVDASSDEDDEGEDARPSRRRKNAHQSIMAFLDDQSESE